MVIRKHSLTKIGVISILIFVMVSGFFIIYKKVSLQRQPYGSIRLPFMRDTLRLLVARNFYQWKRGLSGFDSIPEGYDGMLFIFPSEKIQKFWVYKVKFPLSIYFIDHLGNISASYICVPPCASPPCQVYEGKALYVLEFPCKRSYRKNKIRRVKEWQLPGF